MKPLFCFEDGTLCIDTRLVRMRISWRPKPIAVELRPGALSWTPFFPEFRLVRNDLALHQEALDLDVPMLESPNEGVEAKRAAFAAFCAELPSELLDIVAPFAGYQWNMLVLMNDQVRAVQLAQSNPVLAYALANNSELRGTRNDAAAVQAVWYCHRKQRTVLQWLGFPGTEAVVRLLRKIPAGSVCPSLLRHLRDALIDDDGNDVLGLLSHVQRLNRSVIELVSPPHARALMTPNLLAEVSQLDVDESDAPLVEMLLGGLNILRRIAPDREVRPFSSIAALAKFQEDTDTEYQAYLHRAEMARREAERAAALLREQRIQTARERRRERERQRQAERPLVMKLPFPPPPLPGTATIIPLRSMAQLELEGKEQCNCVSIYAERVKRGELYIYRVMAPERATLSIRPASDGSWRKGELKGVGNCKVKAATVRAVKAWLESYSLSV